MPSDKALLQVLIQFARTLIGHYDVGDVLYELTDRVVEVLDTTAAGVTLADDSGHLRFLTATTDEAATLERLQENHNDGPCHEAFLTGQPIAVHDLRDETEWLAYRQAAERVGLRAVVGIPMSWNDRQLGALNVYNDDPRAWTEADIANAQVLADIATGFVVHASKLEQAKRVNEQLQEALESRIVIEQAKGILAGERRTTVDQAFGVLQSHARRHQASLRSVADAVVRLGLRPEAAPPGAPKKGRPAPARDPAGAG